jgi:fucose permease
LILTLKAKLVNFPTICYIFVLYFWIWSILDKRTH